MIILESNSGYLQLHELLQAAGHRGRVRAEEAQRVLKDLVFDLWRADGCEERSDTLKMLALVDFYLPFLPLERPHIEQLFRMKLKERSHALAESKQAAGLMWDEDIVSFLTDRVRQATYCMCFARPKVHLSLMRAGNIHNLALRSNRFRETLTLLMPLLRLHDSARSRQHRDGKSAGTMHSGVKEHHSI